MTLIAALLDRNGIVLATDSTVTSNDLVTRQARKNFELPHLRGGLSFAGCYCVDGVPLDEWMPRFIARPETYKDGTLSGFAECLRKALDCEMNQEDKKIPTLIHIAGYFHDANGSHPEFHFVRNADEIDPATGEYAGITSTFRAEEQFWHHCKHKESSTGFLAAPHPYDFVFYANGFPAARGNCFLILASLQPYLSQLWRTTDSHFHHPTSLEESICFVRMIMSVIYGLFQMSDYAAPYVGGETQTIGVPLPR
jgi:hypothetical protein